MIYVPPCAHHTDDFLYLKGSFHNISINNLSSGKTGRISDEIYNRSSSTSSMSKTTGTLLFFDQYTLVWLIILEPQTGQSLVVL